MRKRVIIIAGPNGAGKTTFAREYLPNEAQCSVFLNADVIAEELSPGSPESAAIRAGRIMLRRIEEHASRGDTFAFETTLAGRGWMPMIRKWHADGYRIILFFLSLPDAEESIRRVALRVLQGGHNIPEDVIRRRFGAGLQNFHDAYKHEVDAWRLYNNAGMRPVLLAEGKNSNV